MDVSKPGSIWLGRVSGLARVLLGPLCLGFFLAAASDAAATVECGAEYLGQLEPGVFTICKVAPDAGTDFDFTVDVDRANPDAPPPITFVPHPVLQAGDCQDVYEPRSGPDNPADTVTISEEVPAGFQIANICVLNIDEAGNISSHEIPESEFPTISGQIDANKDGCVAIYTNVPDAPFCGDGMVDPNEGETCDPPGSTPDTPPGNMNECRDSCTYCGDGIVNDGEECDDPDDPLCSNECKLIPFCGDGIVDPNEGETCDPPGSTPDTPPGNENVCRDSCTYCGDGIVNNGEECDDPDDPSCTDECKLLCDLEVAKTCELPPPPPAADDKCEGKLQEVTVIWNGDGLVNLTLGDGLIGSSASFANPGDEVTFFTDGSTNDTIVNLSGSIMGQSTFHLSCSDKDMDGATETNEDQDQVSPLGRDCGKDQGDGKSKSGFVNQWLLAGFVDDAGDVLECSADPGDTATVCEVQSVIADCDGPSEKPEVLTWLYSGGGCEASDNDQSSGDLFCEEFAGGINGGLPVTIVDDKDNVFDVAPGETFTTTRDASKEFALSNAGGEEENGRHVSCSQPLQAGDVYGSLTLAALNGAGIGSNVVYAYEVSNEGPETVTDISVVDDQLGAIGSIGSLAPGESDTLTATAFISETTLNVATAEGEFPSGAVCEGDSNQVLVKVLPPPPCDVSIAFYKLDDDKIKWKLSNSTGRKATLETLTLDFPAEFGAIKKVKLDGDIFKADDSDTFPDGVPPGGTIGPDDWTKEDVAKRQLDPGETRNLEVEFTDKDKDASPGDFDLGLTFEEGCQVGF